MFFIQEVLTAQTCAQNIIVRGLVRVRCVQEMDRVLHFMTRKGLINTGVLAVKQPLLPERYCSVSGGVPSRKVPFSGQCLQLLLRDSFTQADVIVVGAGASGLAAARQLQNFGTQVRIIPASLLTLMFPAHLLASSQLTGGGAGGEGESWRSGVG